MIADEAIIEINGNKITYEKSHRIFLEDNKLTLEINGLWSSDDIHILHGKFEKEIKCISLGTIIMSLVELNIVAEMNEAVTFTMKFQ